MSKRKQELSLQQGKRLQVSSRPLLFKQQQCYTGTKLWGEIYSLFFTPDGEHLLAGYGNGAILALKAGDKLAPLFQLKKAKHGGLPATGIRCHPTDPTRILSSSADGKIYLSKFEDNDGIEKVTESGNAIFTFDINAKGDNFATGGKDVHIRLYDTNTFRCLETYEGYRSDRAQQDYPNTHAQRVFTIVWHPDQTKIFLTGGWDNHVKIWDSRLKEPVVAFLNGPHIVGNAIDIKGDTVLVGSWVPQNAFQLWDLRFKKQIKTIPFDPSPNSPGEYLYCCEFGEGDLVFAGSGGVNCCRAIHHETGEIVGSIPMTGNHHVNCLSTTLGGSKVAFGGMCEDIVYASVLNGESTSGTHI